MSKDAIAAQGPLARGVRGRLAETTKWFPANTPPSRVGVYECECGEKHKWDGKRWHVDGDTFKPDHWYLESMNWRGLKHKPSNYASERPAACGRSARLESSTARTTEDE